jgi:hypothetical protein
VYGIPHAEFVKIPGKNRKIPSQIRMIPIPTGKELPDDPWKKIPYWIMHERR